MTKEPNKDDSSCDFDIIIIGAGWSGLSAAQHLQEASMSNFILLEGRHEIGGRCRTMAINGHGTMVTPCSEATADPLSAVVELGAQWIHDAGPNNPIYQVAVESGITMVVSDRDAGATFRGNRQIPRSEVDRQYEKLMTKGFLPYQEKQQSKSPQDVTLRKCAGAYLKKINATREQRLWLNYFLDSEVTQEYAASLEDLSLYWWDSEEEMGHSKTEDVHLAQDTHGGYRGVLNYYAKGITDKIQCNSQVSCIDWSQKEKIDVQYRRHGRPCKLLTARTVLITVPLGVLKANTIQFLPELPEWKQTIINRMGVGLLNKCILLWDDTETDRLPWPQNQEWIERIDDNDQQGRWTEFYNPFPLTKRPMLCAFTAGRVAASIEALSDDEIQTQVMSSLRSMFAPRQIPEPLQVVITRWGQEEFAMGSYSYNAYGASHRFRDRLADPVDKRLYFAGEACSSAFPSTTHGAFLSGAKAAKAIVTKAQSS